MTIGPWGTETSQPVKTLGGILFWKGKRGLSVESVYSRFHIDVEGGSVSCELRANHTGQTLNGGAQVFGVHLLQFNCNCDVEQPAFPFWLRLVREQTPPEYPS